MNSISNLFVVVIISNDSLVAIIIRQRCLIVLNSEFNYKSSCLFNVGRNDPNGVKDGSFRLIA